MPTTPLKNAVYKSLLPFLAPGCGHNPVTEMTGHPVSYPNQYIRLLHRHHVLGSAALIGNAEQQALLFSKSDNPSHKAGLNTCFRVASITKLATAVLTLKLIDLQYLNPDLNLSYLFTAASEKKALDGITIRQLLSHTSGIIDPPFLEAYMTSGKPFDSFLPECRKYKPGDSFHYSNLGFGLIGCILEKILGMTVTGIFRDYLFSILEMNATLEGCSLNPEQIMPVTRILPYHKNTDIIVTELGSVPVADVNPLCHYGYTAGSMYTDILSLYKLLCIIKDNENSFLSRKSLSDMKMIHAYYGSLSPTLSYGLGLLIIKDPNLSAGTIYGHQGFAYGCADGAFWEDSTGNVMILLNGGCSEARYGRLGCANYDFLRWAFRKEIPSW